MNRRQLLRMMFAAVPLAPLVKPSDTTTWKAGDVLRAELNPDGVQVLPYNIIYNNRIYGNTGYGIYVKPTRDVVLGEPRA